MTSVEFFHELPWSAAFQPCSRDMQPPLLEDFCVGVKEDGGAFPSLEVLEAPAVRKLELKYIGESEGLLPTPPKVTLRLLELSIKTANPSKLVEEFMSIFHERLAEGELCRKRTIKMLYV